MQQLAGEHEPALHECQPLAVAVGDLPPSEFFTGSVAAGEASAELVTTSMMLDDFQLSAWPGRCDAGGVSRAVGSQPFADA